MARSNKNRKPLFLVFILIILSTITFFYFHQTSEELAISTTEEFLKYEQEGHYADSWELLHTVMKEKFEQAEYIEMRNDFYQKSLNVESYDYEIIEVDHIEQWRMTKQTDFLSNIYRITVEIRLTGAFGQMKIIQDFFVAEDKENWGILWEYK